jgi:hypothetical protein
MPSRDEQSPKVNTKERRSTKISRVLSDVMSGERSLAKAPYVDSDLAWKRESPPVERVLVNIRGRWQGQHEVVCEVRKLHYLPVGLRIHRDMCGNNIHHMMSSRWNRQVIHDCMTLQQNSDHRMQMAWTICKVDDISISIGKYVQ